MNNTILLLVNHEIVIYNFRKELVERLIDNSYKVIISCPYGKNIDRLTNLGAIHVDLDIDRRGVNPLKDLKLFLHYKRLIKQYKPDAILTYTIKPNLYGGLAARLTKTPCIANITGLGTAIEKRGLLQIFIIKFYKVCLKNAKTVFFQNKENLDFMMNKGVKGKGNKLLPGSGVNVNQFKYIEYPLSSTLHFVYVGRVMKAKGIDYYLESAKTIRKKYPNTVFHILGDFEEDYESILAEYQKNGYIEYHGKVNNVKEYYKIAHAIIHPSFHEGMSNVLLEAASSGRPIIASRISGCKETFDENKTGFSFIARDQESLDLAIEKFINLPYENKRQMGIDGRKKVVNEFDREKIVNIYIDTIKKNIEVY
jgi:galacturonosyltransferase